jgi:hypothetical protein
MHPTATSLSLADTDELVYCFEHCFIDPDGRRVTTRFEDSAEVVAVRTWIRLRSLKPGRLGTEEATRPSRGR